MNYKKIYDNLMESRLLMKDLRIKEKKNGKYFEGHHIIPKCKGGSGNSNRPKNNKNIVLLTAREHYIAHWLLWKIHGDRQMALAFHKMLSMNDKTKRIISSSAYEEAKLAFRMSNFGNTYGKNIKKIITEEQKKRHSEIMKGKFTGEKNPFYGKKHTEKTKDKIREKRKNITKEKTWNYKGEKIVLKDSIIIAKFQTTKEVAEFLGCAESNVRHVLSGNQKTAKGYEIKHFREYYNLLK